MALTQADVQEHRVAEQAGGSPYWWGPQASNRASLSLSFLFGKWGKSIPTTWGVLRVPWGKMVRLQDGVGQNTQTGLWL